jgi:hypothetical protein
MTMDKMIYDEFRMDLKSLKTKVEKINEWIRQQEIKDDTYKSGRYIVGCDPINKTIYKVGDWVIRIEDKDEPNHRKGRLFKILAIYGSILTENYDISHYASSVRLASNDEIKDHLIEEAIKRGLVGWRKFKWDNSFEDITTIHPGYGFEYIHELDSLTVGVAESETRRAIYNNGKWATPVFGKKPFPKNKLELQNFVYAFMAMGEGKFMKDLLDEYENT